MNNNEIMGFSGITRKGVVSFHFCAILTPDLEKRGERYDCYGRNTAHTRRSGGYAPSQTAYYPKVHRQWHIGSRQSWGTLASKTGGGRALPSQEHETRGQKIKPACGWQWTIKHLVAVCLLLKSCEPGRSRPRDSLPIFSIHRSLQHDKVLHSRNMGKR